MEPVRDEVLRQLEVLRQAGDIGSGLDAEVTIHADDSVAARLRAVGDELRFVMITSSVAVRDLDSNDETVKLSDGSRLRVEAMPSAHAKCVRCWHHTPEVGADADHPELCARCIDNVDGDGETRRYA